MEISISFRHMEPSDYLKQYVEEKLKRLERYVEAPLDAHVVMSVERKHLKRIDVMLNLNGIVINAQEVMDDMRAAIDKILDKLERRLKRYREKIRKMREKRKKREEPLAEEEIERVVIRKNIDLKPMDVEEAILQLEASGNNFVVFKDRENDHVCVLYKRKDGNFSIIETRGRAV
ncbi:MAG: ribosome-associated translation inhibitor RaiA [Desulfobacterota bacterium]|nr:ribosome-associated translation inhibitor RaiA [Thermodesulfobacteriota bacterium]MDW8001940.1 ribosome-associated translation inhibitor RaiA [Deltaproteobacteria bacterium]